MKIAINDIFKFQPEIIFALIIDIPHHADWVNEPLDLVSLRDGPAKLGTKWEQIANRSGKRLVTLNTFNIFEKNRRFGGKSEKPFPSQITFLLEPDHDSTKLTWSVESEETGIVQLAEPLLIRQTEEMIQISLINLKAYLQAQT